MDFSLAALFGVSGDAPAWLNVLAVVWRVFVVLIGVNMLVIVHEWGHFIVARMCGVRCDKFYIWFDAYGFKFFSFKRGDTEYGLGWLPLGGYVKMLGQEDNPGGIQAEIERAKAERTEKEKDGALTDDEKKAQDENIARLEKQLYAPDSYLAKNVWQRMAIISAGVFMNVVFAIVCATGACLIGTPETSAKIGYVAPGSPAWKAGLAAGDEIVGIDSNKKPIFSSIIVACMDGKELKLDVRKPGVAEPQTIAVTPRIDAGGLTPTIGVGPAAALDLADVDSGSAPYETSLDPAEAAKLDERFGALKGGERLVSMNGVPVETPAEQVRLSRLFVDKPIEYEFAPTTKNDEGEKVVDASKPTVKISVPPQSAPDVGVRLTMGEIVAIRPGSAAEKAGLRAREVDANGETTRRGDVLLEVDSEPILDPTRLPFQIFRLAGKETREGVAPVPGVESAGAKSVSLTIERDGARQDVALTLPKAASYGGFSSSRGVMSCDSLGVAFEVRPIVAGVDGTTTFDKNPLGGEIVEIEAQVTAPAKDASKEAKQLFKAVVGKKTARRAKPGETVAATTKVEGKTEAERSAVVLGWLSGVAPYLPDGTPLTITVAQSLGKDAGTVKIETKMKRAQDAFVVERGLYFAVDFVFSRADNFGDALKYGFAKTYESASQVFVFLKNVGKNVSAKALGGPGMIVGTAYAAAGRADGVFLLFLCLIGANLAVVNFLPIPVLDGGHMVFLLYEAIARRKPNENVQVVLSYIGLFLILGLMFWVIFLDVVRYCF